MCNACAALCELAGSQSTAKAGCLLTSRLFAAGSTGTAHLAQTLKAVAQNITACMRSVSSVQTPLQQAGQRLELPCLSAPGLQSLCFLQTALAAQAGCLLASHPLAAGNAGTAHLTQACECGTSASMLPCAHPPWCRPTACCSHRQRWRAGSRCAVPAVGVLEARGQPHRLSSGFMRSC